MHLLETAHPDPFRAVGGRVEFHRRVRAIERSIPDDGLTRSALLARIQPVAAAVRDGHTQVHGVSSRTDGPGPRVWVEFEPIDGQLVVRTVHREADVPYIGSVVEAASSRQRRRGSVVEAASSRQRRRGSVVEAASSRQRRRGSVVEAVEGVPVAELLARVQRRRGFDNAYGALVNLSD